MPRPRTYTRVLAVPRSTAMSRPSRERRFSAIDGSLPKGWRQVPGWPAPVGAPTGYGTEDPTRRASRTAFRARLRGTWGAGSDVTPRMRAGEEQCDLPRRRFVRVGAVDEILGGLDPEVAPDGARRRLGRVRRAHHEAHHGVRVLRALDHHDERGRTGDERTRSLKKGPLRARRNAARPPLW